GRAGSGEAVLIRALEPLEGRPLMEARRGQPMLCTGPARLVQALGIQREHDGCELQAGPLQLLAGSPVPNGAVGRGPRIGISRGLELPLRFFIKGNPCISR
ncbi:MAG: DNA-3-methyladenine glycosylase, partial [Planctomycetota bacterium]|nr:DNA-3-methyladenine glycosylase [Planctomycetota bacterium]